MVVSLAAWHLAGPLFKLPVRDAVVACRVLQPSAGQGQKEKTVRVCCCRYGLERLIGVDCGFLVISSLVRRDSRQGLSRASKGQAKLKGNTDAKYWRSGDRG